MKYLFGNWKMHLNGKDAVRLASDVLEQLTAENILTAGDSLEIAILPPAIWLESITRVLNGKLATGAQHCHGSREGAFTGETSAEMIRDAGARWCLVGHSERRQVFGETPGDCARRLEGIIRAGLRPIICVGETQQERASGKTLEILRQQLRPCLAVSGLQSASPVIAYEPVWSIGSGNVPSNTDISDALSAIIQESGPTIPVLYGGSVSAENAPRLAEIPQLSGLLVGGASLSAAKFTAIAKALHSSAANT